MSATHTSPGSEQTPPSLVDTSAMPTIHTFFRRELRLAGGLVRGIPEGDRQRAEVVVGHLDFLRRSLHGHHTIEDELLWPVLLGRVPEELAPIVHLMESQHERVDALLEQVDAALPRLRAADDPALREELADTLDTLYVHLVEHLDAEEDRLLPIAARCLTQAEWDALGEAGRATSSRKDGLLALGMFQHDGDPADFATMIGHAPPPVRWVLQRAARWAFRRHALRVHGTVTP